MIPRSRIVHAVDPAPLYLYGVNSKNQTVAVPGGSVALSVTGFGAVGDGVTDDTAAIQAAASAGGPVYFPPGTYLISAAITLGSNTRLLGAGKYLSVLKRAAASPMSYMLGNLADVLQDVTIENLGFDANGTNNTIATDDCIPVYFDDTTNGSSDIVVKNCEFHDFGEVAHGIHIKGCVGLTVWGNIFPDGGGPIFYHPIYLRRVGDVLCCLNRIRSVLTNTCIKVQPLAGGGRCVVAWNITDGADRGILVQSGNEDRLDTIIAHNIVRNATVYGIIHTKETGSVKQQNLSITDNIISGTQQAIVVLQGQKLTIADNTIDGVTSRGIVVKDCTQFNVHGNTIVSADPIDAGGLTLIEIPDGTTTFRGMIYGNCLTSSVASGTRYGIDVVENTYSSLRVFGNEFASPSGNWTLTERIAGNVTRTVGYEKLTDEINEPAIQPSATGARVKYSCSGTDANITLELRPKGSGSVYATNGYGDHLEMGPGTATVVNRVRVVGSISTASPSVEVAGSDSNIGMRLVTKGNGKFNLRIGGVPTYADDTAAGVGGLAQGDVYKTSAGSLQIKL